MAQPRITFSWETTALATAPIYPHLTHDPRFPQYLGTFFAGWANIELLTSYLIGKLLKIRGRRGGGPAAGARWRPTRAAAATAGLPPERLRKAPDERARRHPPPGHYEPGAPIGR